MHIKELPERIRKRLFIAGLLSPVLMGLLAIIPPTKYAFKLLSHHFHDVTTLGIWMCTIGVLTILASDRIKDGKIVLILLYIPTMAVIGVVAMMLFAPINYILHPLFGGGPTP